MSSVYHLRLLWQRLNSNTDQTDCTDIPDLSSPVGLTYQEVEVISLHLDCEVWGNVSVRRIAEDRSVRSVRSVASVYHLRLVRQRLNSNTDQTDCTDLPDLSRPVGLTPQRVVCQVDLCIPRLKSMLKRQRPPRTCAGRKRQ